MLPAVPAYHSPSSSIMLAALGGFPCDKCRKVCKSPRGLKQHITAAHQRSSQLEAPMSDVQRQFHPSMTGKKAHLVEVQTVLLTLPAHPCDKNGAFLTPEMPPVPPPPRSDDDWTPFRSRTGFKLVEFLYKEELSKPKIDHLLSLWSTTLAPHGAEPPVSNYCDLHAQIDSIDLGFTSWKSWTAWYQGRRPTNSAAFSWMDEEYQLWYRDPRKVIHDILRNPDFSAATDYTPYRDFQDGKRHYCDFMSGNWSWNQCVCIILRRNLKKYFSLTSSLESHRDGFTNTWVYVCSGHYWFR